MYILFVKFTILYVYILYNDLVCSHLTFHFIFELFQKVVTVPLWDAIIMELVCYITRKKASSHYLIIEC